MSEQYRLVYSAELNEGQHAAVVKKRLAAILKLDDARMDVLFSGKSVVVKKATDEKTAARYQEVFNKAGARLRILPVEGAGSAVSDAAPAKQSTKPSTKQEAEKSAPKPQDSPVPTPSSAPITAEDGSLGILPVGVDLLTDEERNEEVEADVDISHLSVQGAVFQVDEPENEPVGPNVDHLSLADVGAQIGESAEEIVAEIDADFDLAEVGAIIGGLDEADTPAPPAADFDLADSGADLDTSEKKPPPPPPDTSHLSIDDD